MKVYFDTIGCRLNQAEIERMAIEFRQAGHEIVETSNLADVVIINSCAVTAAAASDSRQKVRQAHKAGALNIYLTGCWSTLSPQEALALPGVKGIFSNDEKSLIPEKIMGQPVSLFEMEPIERKPLPGSHKRTRAFIKVQDGCENHCTFCITRIARGISKSTDKSEILAQIHSAEKGDSHEIVLTGVNLGAWGKDLGQGETLADLVRSIINESKVDRLRLSSVEPWDLDTKFLSLWQDGRMCKHLHIPLQSGSAETLKRMARRTTPEKFRQLIEEIRARIPDAAITTDIIVGFAGETNEGFQESLAFVKQIHFAGGHVFRFSPREGTPAWNFPNKVNGKTAHQRAELMREALRVSEVNYWQKFLGQTLNVLWESANQIENGLWRMQGLTDNYLPVMAETTENRWNRIEPVHLSMISDEYIGGEIVH